MCQNTKTGELEVTEEFFNIVWEENKTDDSWNAWVCFSNGDVIGFIVVQTFVHESNYFQWGSPLDKSQKPNTETGEFHDIVEISLLCAKGCGRMLLEHVLKWLAENTNYKNVVLNSTKGAESWYLKQGFKPVSAYRLPWKSKSKRHLYRHRIPDHSFDPNLDPPSIMLYQPIIRMSPIRPSSPPPPSEPSEPSDGLIRPIRKRRRILHEKKSS